MRTAGISLACGISGAFCGWLALAFGLPVLLAVVIALAVAGPLAWFLHGPDTTAEA